MHNGHSICYVHTDLKPDNILVVIPSNHQAGFVPEQPIFKITDFARLTEYPAPQGQKPKRWAGTYAFAPPRAEREGQIHPAVDMYGLGATIHNFALHIIPNQCLRGFIADRAEAGLSHPALSDDNAWLHDHWLSRLPVLYRPLNATRELLWSDYDTNKWELQNHTPYSDHLNLVYKRLFDNDPRTRITAVQLKDYLVNQMSSCRKQETPAMACLK
jgi:serine/threonine protein kinase